MTPPLLTLRRYVLTHRARHARPGREQVGQHELRADADLLVARARELGLLVVGGAELGHLRSRHALPRHLLHDGERVGPRLGEGVARAL